MESGSDWPNIYDAASDSSSTSNKSVSGSSMSTSNSSRSVKSSQDSEIQECLTSAAGDANQGAAQVPKAALNLGSLAPMALDDHDYHQLGPMLSPPASDQSPDIAPHCTGCKSSSPAVANCFSCSALLCANCVIAHQLMLAFEGHHVTNLGQNTNKTLETVQGSTSIDGVKKMVKEAKKKLNELQKTVKSVDYSSSRYTINCHFLHAFLINSLYVG